MSAPVFAVPALLSAAAWLYLVVGHGRFWLADQRLPASSGQQAPASGWPSVVAVVPARDEAAVLPLTLPTLLGGSPIWLGLTAAVHSIRPYPWLADFWDMIARSAYVQLRHSPLLLGGTLLGLLLLYAVPPVFGIAFLIAALAGSGGGWAIATAAAGLARGRSCSSATCRRCGSTASRVGVPRCSRWS